MPLDGVPGESRDVWVQLLMTVNGLADGTREWRNWFSRCCQRSGVRDEVWEHAISKLKQCFTFGCGDGKEEILQS